MKYEPVIGLEVHIELSTKSKMFCACSADYFGAEPNTHTCPICLGLPGSLPSPNRLAVEYAQKLGLALNCRGLLSSKFDRKNYFYPDLPKGFQISQYDLPFSQNGFVNIKTGDGKDKKIKITRAHLEEDTGKLTHATVKGRRVTLIDFNRSGVPLMEVVSEPEISSSQEAKAYAQKLQQIVRYLKISDADMEKGSMRIEPNVSLKKTGSKQLPQYKVELKNINSFRFAQRAIEFEIKRQSQILDSGEIPPQETRGWNEAKGETFSQRTKELAFDYRYFPEPDIPPFSFVEKYINQLKSGIGEMPDIKLRRFVSGYGLTEYDAEILTRDPQLSIYFDEAVRVAKNHKISPKQVANALIHQRVEISKTLPATLVKNIMQATQVMAIDQKELEKIVEKVISENFKAVKDYKKGKLNAIMFLIGQVMSSFKGKVDSKLVRKLIEAALKK